MKFFIMTIALIFSCALCAQRPGTERPCAEDVEKYCKDKESRGATLDCLKENEKKISPACAANIKNNAAKNKEQGKGKAKGPGASKASGEGNAQGKKPSIREVCAEDLAKHCANKKSRDEAMDCLVKDKIKLSDKCKELINKWESSN